MFTDYGISFLHLEQAKPEQVEGERNVARGIDDPFLDRVPEQVATHRPFRPMLCERCVELGVGGEPSRLVHVLDQHEIEGRVLFVVARDVRVLERDMERLVPDVDQDADGQGRQERREQ